MKTVLITGATSGIGKATAIALARLQFRLIITGRRTDRLFNLADELIKTYQIDVLPLVFDVRNEEEVKTAIGSLTGIWTEIDILINNAGLASGFDPIQNGLLEDWEIMIDTNLKGLLYVSKAVIPMMIKRGKGHIINISSIAGHEVYPNGNVYCATKHAVEALSKGMRQDLLPYRIKVTSLAPGMVETEFSIVRFHGDTQRAKQVYEGMTPLRAEDIADAIVFIITRPDHVCINEMLIMPTDQASATLVNRQS